MSEPELSRSAWFSLLLTRFIWGVLLAIPAGFLVMFLWNSIVTQAISGANPIDFWQSLGLLVLCRLLFYSGWLTQGHTPTKTPKRALPEEDRAAFLARIRQRLAEADEVRPGNWSSGGNHE